MKRLLILLLLLSASAGAQVLSVPNGGTGNSTVPQGTILTGNGTGPLVPIPQTVINVKNAPYNATGNGIADDTAALTAAFAAASTSHACIYLPSGNYNFNNTLALTGGPGQGTCIRGDNMENSRLVWTGNDATKEALKIDGAGGTYSDFAVAQQSTTGHDWKVGIVYGPTYATLAKFTSVTIACGGYNNQNLGDAMWLFGPAGTYPSGSTQADQITLDRAVLEFCSNGYGLQSFSPNAVDINLYNTTVFYNHIGMNTGNSNINVFGGTWISLDLAIAAAGGPSATFTGVRSESLKRLLWMPGGTWVKPMTISNWTASINWENVRPTTTGGSYSTATGIMTVPTTLGRRPGVDPGWVEGDNVVVYQDPTHVYTPNISAVTNKGASIQFSSPLAANLTNATLVSPYSCTVNTTAGSNNIVINGDPCVTLSTVCIVGAGVAGGDWCEYAFTYDSATSGHFGGGVLAGASVTNAQIYSPVNHWGQQQVTLPASGPYVVQNNFFGQSGSHFSWGGGGTVTFEGNMFPDNAPNPGWIVGAALPADWNWRNNLTNYGGFNAAVNGQTKMANRDVTTLAQDVSTYGVKADGNIGMNCHATAPGATTLACYSPGNVSTGFTAADQGKLIVIYSAGNPTGQVKGDGGSLPGQSAVVPAITPTGCTPSCTGGLANTVQPVQFNDTGDGCSTKPTGASTLGAAIAAAGGGQSLAITLNTPFPVTVHNNDHILIGGTSTSRGEEAYVYGEPANQTSFTIRFLENHGAHAIGEPVTGVWSISTAVYGWIQLDANGQPTGPLIQHEEVFLGEGCTRPPTQGTVGTITGTVNFTGGAMVVGDWPTTIASVQSASAITVTDPVPVGAASGDNMVVVYGSDDHDAWQTACNSNGGSGHFTFKGISLVSHGFVCSNASFWLQGAGVDPMGSGVGSILVYGGKGNTQYDARGHDWILGLSNGYQAHISNMGFRGNTMAKPYGIMPTLGSVGGTAPTPTGSGIGQMYTYDNLWIGWEWGDREPGGVIAGYSLQSCFFPNGSGNVDFGTLNNIYCYNAEVGFDGHWDQNTAYTLNNISVEHSNIALACWTGMTVGTGAAAGLYTERNRLDIMLGSPTSVAGDPYAGCVGANINYGGESSAMEVDEAPLYGSTNGGATINGGIGLDAAREFNINPSLNMVDVSRGMYAFSWNNGLPYPNGRLTYILLPPSDQMNYSLSLSQLLPEQIRYAPGGETSLQAATYDLYGNLIAPKFTMKTNDGKHYIDVDVMGNQTHPATPNQPNGLRMGNWNSTILQKDVYGFQNTVGSILVSSPRPPGQTDNTNGTAVYWVGLAPYCPAGNGTTACPGSITYNYQITCVDGRGLETAPLTSTFHGATTGTPGSFVGDVFQWHTTNIALDASNYNRFSWGQMRGCAGYNVYGDNGIGGAIGYLAYVSATAIAGLVFDDHGTITKSARVAPVVSNSGSIEVEHNITIDSLKGLSCIGTDANGKIIPGTCGTGPGGGISSITSGGVTSTAAAQTFVGAGGISIATTTAGQTTFTGTAATYPAAGIANSTGTAWGTSYSATNPIPANFLAPIPINTLAAATGSDAVEMGQYGLAFDFSANPTAGFNAGFYVRENPLVANPGGPLMTVASGSANVFPFLAVTSNGAPTAPGAGIRVEPNGALSVVNGTNLLTFTTPASGNPVISSSAGGVTLASLFVSNLTGSGASCLQTDALGNVTRSGAPCGTGTGTATPSYLDSRVAVDAVASPAAPWWIGTRSTWLTLGTGSSGGGLTATTPLSANWTTALTAGSGGGMYNTNYIATGASNPRYSSLVSLPAAGDLTNTTVRVGVYSSASVASLSAADPAGLSFVGFRFVGGTDTNWMCERKDGTTGVYVSSGVAVTAGSWYKLAVVFNTTAQTVDYFIGTALSGSPVEVCGGPLSANLPAAGTVLYPFTVTVGNGTAAENIRIAFVQLVKDW